MSEPRHTDRRSRLRRFFSANVILHVHIPAWILVLIAVVLITLLAGCSPDTKKDAPEPTSGQIVDGTNTRVIRMPDGFRNVVFSCFGTNGVYVTSRGSVQNGASQYGTPLASSVFVLPNDVHCR